MTLLERYRTASGLTQEGLAKKLGVTPGAVSLWESGRWKPHPKRIRQLAKILELSPIELTRIICPEMNPGATAK